MVTTADGRVRSRERATRLFLPVLIATVVVYTFIIRTRGISDHFFMLGDEIRDWSVALGPLSGLPLVGPPSIAGGYSYGPIFYWVLWLIRVIVGPFTGNLPHAGGLGLAAIQSCADGVLCLGIRKCSGSWTFALGTVLIVASSPFDLALSSVIWNPVLAVALAKAATGLVLYWQDDLSRPRRVVLFALGWLAVQAHTPAMPFGVSVFIWVLASQFRLGRRRAMVAGIEAALVVLLLQAPSAFAAESIRQAKVVDAIAHPQRFRLLESFHALTASVETIALGPWSVPQTPFVLLGAGAALLLMLGPFTAPVAASVLPLAVAVGMWSIWQDTYDSYWFLTVIPAAVLTVVWVVRLLPGRGVRSGAAALLLAAAILAQKPRIERAALVFRLPAYGAVIKGSRALVRRGEPVRRIEAPFLPATSDPEFAFRILGGQIRPDAAFAAKLSEDGTVTYYVP